MASTPALQSPPISHPAHTLLSRAHPPSHATQIFTDKVANKPLLLTTTSTQLPTDKRGLRRHIRLRKQQYHVQHRKPRPLSAKEKRGLKLYDLQHEEIRYEIYKGLNALWQGYILEVLGFMRDGTVVDGVQKRVVTQASHGSLIAGADFHGMEVEVVRCKDVGRVGLRGIVVRETKGSVVLVTKKDAVTRILKRGAVFRVVVGLPVGEKEAGGGGGGSGERKLVFELHGSQLEVRPVDRAVRKFKWHPIDYL